MSIKKRTPSPMLAVASEVIGEASSRLVTDNGRFKHTFEAPVAQISPDPEQSRKTFDDAGISALATTMAEQGQLQPVLLRHDPERKGHWILVAGERRWRAARLNDWQTLLAIEHEGDAEVAALLENLQRVDLTPLEEARGVRRLLADKGWTQARTATALGRSKGEVSATLRLLDLPPALVEHLDNGSLDLSRNVLVELARIGEGSARDDLLELAKAGKITVRLIRERLAAAETSSAIRSSTNRTVPANVSTKLAGLHSLNGLVKRLRDLRTAKHSIGDDDRTLLIELRNEIDALVGGK